MLFGYYRSGRITCRYPWCPHMASHGTHTNEAYMILHTRTSRGTWHLVTPGAQQ